MEVRDLRLTKAEFKFIANEMYDSEDSGQLITRLKNKIHKLGAQTQQYNMLIRIIEKQKEEKET